MLKGHAGKLVPKFVRPYKVLESFPQTSNYVLELPNELKQRWIQPRFHVNLLHPHHPSDDLLFPDRTHPEPYNFGAPDDAEWYVDEITGHRWKGHSIEFLVKWNLGDSTWELLETCDPLAALDDYHTLMGVSNWNSLP